jgi:hypothetical protein
MPIDTTTVSLTDSSQIFGSLASELNCWYRQTAEKTANKVHKISLKLIGDAADPTDASVPEVLQTGANPTWTKRETSLNVTFSVRGTDLVADRPFKAFILQAATRLEIQAQAYTPPGGAYFEILDNLVAEKTWIYKVQK